MKVNLFIIKNVYIFLVIAIDTFFLIFFRAISFNRIKSDYFLSNIGGLGDSVLFLSLILHNKSIISDKGEINLLVNENYKFIFENLEDLGFKIHTVNPKKYSRNLFYRLRFNFYCSRFQVKFAAKIRGGRNGIFDDSIIRFVKGQKIGLKFDPNDKAANGVTNFLSNIVEKFFFDEIINFDSNSIVHEFQRNSILIKHVFNFKYKNFTDLDNKCFIETENYFRNDPIFVQGNYCVFNIGSNNINRSWDLDNFIKLSKVIEEKYYLIPVFCGLSKDSLLLENAGEKISSSSINLCGKLSLEKLINVINNSSLCISNDSGPANIAVSLNKKSICIKNNFGDYRFFPLPKDSSYKNHLTISMSKLNEITVEMVEEGVKNFF